MTSTNMGVPTIFPLPFICFLLNRYLKCSSQVTHVVDQSHLQKVKNFAYASPPTSHEAAASWSPLGTSNSDQQEQQRYTLLLLMVQKSGDHQLRLVVNPIIHRGLGYIQTVVGLGIFFPSTVSELGNQVASMFGGVLWAATLKPRRPVETVPSKR